jgi:hypothetical protein
MSDSELDRRPWRVGTHWGVTIIAEGSGAPDEGQRRLGDELIATAQTKEWAQQICDDHNEFLLDTLGPARSRPEFKMVDSATLSGLEEGVNLMLDQGWALHGVTMMATEPGGLGTAGLTCRYVQALVREAGWGSGGGAEAGAPAGQPVPSTVDSLKERKASR